MKLAILSFAVLATAGCGSGTVQERGVRIARELRATFPDQIVEVSFENAPQVSTPTLFVGMSPAMSSEVVRHFLCVQIKPIVDAAGGGIDAVTTYGWSMIEECT